MNDGTARPRSLRFAFTLNLLLPGAGQLYLGQTVLGASYMVGFVCTFVTILMLFLRAYAAYLEQSTGGEILEGDNLERLSHAFPVGWLVGLTAFALVVYAAAMVSLRLPRKQPPDVANTSRL